MEMRYNAMPVPSSALSMYLALMTSNRFESRLTKLNAEGPSEVGSTRLWTQCLKSRIDHNRMTCHVFDGSRTRLVSLDAETGAINPLAWVPGRFAVVSALNDEWLSGWLGSEPVAIGVNSREGLRLSSSTSYRANQITAAGGVVATIAYDGKGSTLRLYSSSTTLRASGR